MEPAAGQWGEDIGAVIVHGDSLRHEGWVRQLEHRRSEIAVGR